LRSNLKRRIKRSRAKARANPAAISANTSGRRRPDPDEAYHYQPLRDSEMMGWLERTLIQDQLYFSSPASFNDPFDSKVEPSFDGTDNQKRTYLEKLAAQRFKSASADSKAMIDAALADPDFFIRGYRAGPMKDIETLGVYCVSRKPDEILMWSHYADSHRGVCLVLALSTMFPNLAVEAVEYPKDNQYPNVNFFTATNDELMQAALLTKSNHWKYECEWRVEDISGPGWHDIDPNGLRGLIVGCLTPPSKVSEIKQLASKRRISLPLFQARKRHREFALDIRPLV
jgi:hypothetical protein